MPTAPMQPIRRVPPLGAFLEGWRRVADAPVLVLGTAAAIWLVAMLVDAAAGVAAAPPVAQRLALGPGTWVPALRLIHEQAEYLSRVLAPEFTPVLHPTAASVPWMAAQGLKAAFWLFLTGGVLDRLARGRPIRTAAFFAACGVYFLRFLRLAVIVGLPVWAVVWAQRSFVGVRSVHVGAGVLILAIAIVVEFAKVRAVVEDRHSMLSALTGAIRFIRRRLRRVLALGFLNALALLVVLRIEFQVAATPAPRWLAMILFGFVVLLGVAARLASLASEAVFFQGELAHAGYTAAPLPVWPESPAMEAIDNLVQRSAVRDSRVKIQK